MTARTMRHACHRNGRWLAGLMAGLACVAGAACSSSGEKPLHAEIVPAHSRIPVGPHTQALTLTLQPMPEEGEADWWIDGAGIGNSTVGYLGGDPDPMVVRYTPPAAVPTPDTVTVRVKVTSPGYAEASASATIQVVPPVSVAVTPDQASVRVGETLQFAAQVAGTAEQEIAWSVDEIPWEPGSPGTIDAGGLYTAPAMKLSYPVTIRATSLAFPMVSGTATVQLRIRLTVEPAEVSLPFGGSQQFTATVAGTTTSTGVLWSSSAGPITGEGLYTAPADARSDDVVQALTYDDGIMTVAEVPVHLVPPPVSITSLSGPAAPGDTLVVTGSGFVGEPELNVPMVDGSTAAVASQLVSGTELRATVPPGSASGLVSVTMRHGRIPATTSNAVTFSRLPRLRLHAPQRDLAPGETVALQVAYLGAGPLPLTWSADAGSVDAGTFRAPADVASDGFARVTACVEGTASCDTVVLGLHPFRIDPAAGLATPGGSIALSAIGSAGPTPATWQVVSGGGSIAGDGTYTASALAADAGPVVVAATVGSFVEEAPLGVWGASPGLVARASDYADYRIAPVAGTVAELLAVDGERAHVLATRAREAFDWEPYQWIDTYDVSDPRRPVWLGATECTVRRAWWQPIAAGGHLHVRGLDVAGRSSLALYDLGTGLPRWVGQDATHAWEGLVRDGDLLYALDVVPASATAPAAWTLRVHDTRTGSLAPSRTVSLPDPGGEIGSFAVGGDRLYASVDDPAFAASRLLVLDISGPDGRLVATVQDGTWWRNLRLAGGLLFTGSIGYSVDDYPTHVYDVGTEVPALVSTIPPMLIVGVSGTRFLGTTYQSGMRVVDLADPGQPQLVASFLTSVTPGPEPAWVGTHVLLPEWAGGLAVYDVSAPGGPEPGTPVGELPFVRDVLVRGDTMFQSVNEPGPPSVRILDLGREPPAEVGSVVGPPTTCMEAGGGHLYAGRYPNLEVWDVTSPAAPVQVASLATPAAFLGRSGGVLYAVARDDQIGLRELVALDVAVPSTPVRLGSVPVESYPRALAITGTTVLVAGGPGGLSVFDASNPEAMVLASQLDLGAEVLDVEAGGDLAYLATSAGLVVVDVGDPARPRVRATACQPDWYPFSGYPPQCAVSRVAVAGDLVWTFGWYATGWDVRDPARPRLVSLAMLPVAADAPVEVRWPRLYTLAGPGRVWPIDVSRARNVVHMLFPPEGLGRP